MKIETCEFLKSMATDASIFNANMQHYILLDGIKGKIQRAWEVWDNETTKGFWEGEGKPVNYTDSFAKDWIENEDFEADGYDESELDNLFGTRNS